MKDYQLLSSVALSRNYVDLPFDCDSNGETAKQLNERVNGLLNETERRFLFTPSSKLSPEGKRLLSLRHLITTDAAEMPFSCQYIAEDETMNIQTAGENHIRIAAWREKDQLKGCCLEARTFADLLEKGSRYAYSDEYGFLTARPWEAGKGLAACIVLHLPMTILEGGLAEVMRLAVENRIQTHCETGIRPELANGLVLAESREDTGENTEETLEKLSSFAENICAKEQERREKACNQPESRALDTAYRAYGIAKYARMISQADAEHIWSALTLGMSLGMAQVGESHLDKLWGLVNGNQTWLYQTASQQKVNPDILRARRIRDILDGGN